ncbi:hypothetical protein UT300007_10220 [Clostridium sp. CTA-7]
MGDKDSKCKCETKSSIDKVIDIAKKGNEVFKISSDITKSINKMKDAWNSATLVLKAHEAASRLTLVTINGGLPILTTLIGVLTGKISLATAAHGAWNAVMNMSMGPIGLVVVAISALTAGFLAYSLMQKDAYNGQKRLDEANESLGNSYQKVADKAVEFHNGIKSAGNILDGFNESIIVSNEEQQNLSTRMNQVQEEISQIARNAKEERRSLTESEIGSMNELFEEMHKLTQKELEIQEAHQQVVKDRSKVMADTYQGTAEEYEAYSQRLINSAEKTREAVIQKADEQCTEEIALINAKYEALGEKGNEAYNAEIEAANNKYISSVEAANKECGDTLAIIQEGYANRATELENYITKTNELKILEEEENNKYNAALEAENDRHSEALKTSDYDSAAEYMRHNSEISRIKDEHTNKMADIRAREVEDLDKNAIDQAGVFLKMVSETELYGGEMSKKTRDMANSIIDNFDKLPEGTRKTMENTMSPMLTEMEKSEPGLLRKAEGIAGGILSRLRKSFDINSPSRKTRKIFRSVMEGAEKGIDDEESNVYEKTSDLAKGVLNELSASNFDIASLVRKIQDTVNFESARISTGITFRNNGHIIEEFNDNNTSDGIKEGSTFILPIYMDSDEISEYTYRKVDNQFALAGKRVR